MEIDLVAFREEAFRKKRANDDFYRRIRLKAPKDLDKFAEQYHNEVTEETDCLTCANCCKSISAIVIDRDIDRIAKHLRMKPVELIEKHFILDKDEDYVFNQSPCPFLMPDNYCSIYDVRPRACREYPHTDRKRFDKITKLTAQNCLICPIVLKVTDKLKLKYVQG